MKRVAPIVVCGAVAALCLHLACGLALADDAAWRPVYDTAMRWVNFLILAFLLYKFGRTPLMNFLKGQRFDIAREIEDLEAQREAAAARLREMRQELEASSGRFVTLSERIIGEGERRRDELIADARLEGQMLLESARRKAEWKFIQARQRLRSQLVDDAVDAAIERLPALVSEADNRRLLKDFLQQAVSN